MWNSYEDTWKEMISRNAILPQMFIFNHSVCHTYVEIEGTVHICVGSRLNLYFMMALLLPSWGY